MGSRGARLAVVIGAFVTGACGGDRALGVAAEFVRAARSVRLEVKTHSAEAARTGLSRGRLSFQSRRSFASSPGTASFTSRGWSYLPTSAFQRT